VAPKTLLYNGVIYASNYLWDCIDISNFTWVGLSMVDAAAGPALFGFAKNPSNGRNAEKIGIYRLYVA